METEKRCGGGAGRERRAGRVDDVFERVKPEMAALSADELLSIKLDVSVAVATVLDAFPRMQALREQIMEELPRFDVARFDKLEDYALALGCAHAELLSISRMPDGLEELTSEALERRERLLAEVRALVQHGIVDDAELAPLKGAKGYKNIASDLLMLANVLQKAWPRIEGKVFTTARDLETALDASSRLFRVVEQRERAPSQVAGAMERRVRAFTLLAAAYDDARRAVAYLRAACGDADVVAPSLYPGRPRPRKLLADRPSRAPRTR